MQPIPATALEAIVLDAAPVCVLVGPDHVFERLNDRFRHAFPGRDLEGRRFREAFPDLADGEVFWILDDVWRSGQAAVAAEVRGVDRQREAFYSFLLQPVRDAGGATLAVVAVGIDVTAQVESRRRVEALERRSAFLAEASATLASSLEPAETLATVAHLAVHHFADWCAVDLAGGDLGAGAVAAADPDLEPVLAELQDRYPPRPGSGSLAERALAGEALLLGEDELFAVGLDEQHARLLGRILPASALAVPLRARGQTLGVLTLAWVRRGQKYTAEDLGLAEEFARHAAIAVDNARLYREAQASIQVREDFLGIAGHELKTPLTALKLQLQSLERAANRAAPPRLDQVSDRLTRMGHQIQRLEKLMSDLLDVSLVTAGRLNLTREETDLRRVVVEVVRRQDENVVESGSPVTVDAPEPVVGWLDPARVDQVVQNLFTNALKYGRGKPIVITLHKLGDRARLTLRDHGIGIAPEAQGRIFGRFERAVSNRHYGGFGLGLWIVRQIVDASGGRIWFESATGEGTTFYVELPLNLPAAASSPP